MGNKLGRSDRSLIDILSRYLPGGIEKYYEKFLAIAGVPTEIRTERYLCADDHE
jgi:hypothetical protein